MSLKEMSREFTIQKCLPHYTRQILKRVCETKNAIPIVSKH